ncbi:MAG: carbohydrate ABC transporter permease [Anaerolineae bacterium]|nr:carbohydrate ABC transporter permease [Anaerolineae bacterium]
MRRSKLGEQLFAGANYVVVILFTVFCFLPFYLLVISSFTDQQVLQLDGYSLWPRKFSIEAYKWVLNGKPVLVGYQVSTFVTVVGTFLSVALMSGVAYALSVKKFKFRNQLSFYIYFTMIFSGGLIPWFITCRALGLYDNIWALIVPMLMNPWWIFILRNYFNGLPGEIMESAVIDGASDWTILTRIVLPLSMPVLATTALFVAVGYWNDWWHGVILLDFAEFRPLQVIILRIINSIRAIRQAMAMEGGSSLAISSAQIPAKSIRMAIVVVTIGPIILLYPFVQRYFIKGLTVGSVKG